MGMFIGYFVGLKAVSLFCLSAKSCAEPSLDLLHFLFWLMSNYCLLESDEYVFGLTVLLYWSQYCNLDKHSNLSLFGFIFLFLKKKLVLVLIL